MTDNVFTTLGIHTREDCVSNALAISQKYQIFHIEAVNKKKDISFPPRLRKIKIKNILNWAGFYSFCLA